MKIFLQTEEDGGYFLMEGLPTSIYYTQSTTYVLFPNGQMRLEGKYSVDHVIEALHYFVQIQNRKSEIIVVSMASFKEQLLACAASDKATLVND